MAVVEHRGAAIFWREQGSPALPPLVLLHSIGTDHRVHDHLAPLLSAQFRLLHIDIRGHGASSASAGDYAMGLLAEDVLAVMDSAGAESALVCGTSLGAMIAMQLALDAPQRVRGLALACTSPAMDPQFWAGRMALVRDEGLAAAASGWAARHFSPQFLTAHPALAAALEARLAAMSTAGYLGCAAAIRDMDLLSGLSGVRVPTTVIAGQFDSATPYAGHGERIAAAMPQATVAMLPAGHLACIEQPEHFASAVLALAARCG